MDATLSWAGRPGEESAAGSPIYRRLQPWLLLTVAMMAVGAALHYGDKLPLISAAAASSPVPLTTRQTIERILFLMPVMSAAFVFGARAGLLPRAVSSALMFPRALGSEHTDHALPEIGGVLVVGALLVLAITQQRREVEVQTRMRQNLHRFVSQVLPALGDRRRLTQNLRPGILDDHGLVPALEWLADVLRDQYGIEASLQIAEPLPGPAPETQLLLFPPRHAR